MWLKDKLESCPGKTRLAHITLTLGLPEQMFQMAHLHMTGSHGVKLFFNPSKIVQVTVWTNSDRQTDTQMHGHTPNCHCDNNASLTASRLRLS